MTVSSTTNRSDYVGNGAVDTYAYSWRIFSNTDLQVTVRDTAGVETDLTLTTHYTVTGVGDAGGGNVALVNGAFDWIDAEGDLKTDYILTIRRVRPLTQLTDIRNQGVFFPEAHEDEFDKGRMIDQQQQDELDRSVKLPETLPASDFDPTLPTDLPDNPGSVVIVNPAGDGFVTGPTADDITGAGGYASAASASAVAAAASAVTADGFADDAAASAADAAASAAAAVANGTFETAAVSIKTDDYIVLSTDYSRLLIMNAATAKAFTLPAVANSKVLLIKNIGAGLLTITPDGSDTVDIATLKQNQAAILIGDSANTKWRSLSRLIDLSAVVDTVAMSGAAINQAKGADIASATTTNLGAATGNFVHVTGTTTITGLGTVQAGTQREVKFTGILTLTHNATSLILPGAANITTAVNDRAKFVSLGSGNWLCLWYQKADGTALVVTSTADGGVLGSYKNLKIVMDSATQVTVTADELVLEDASNNKAIIRSVSEAIAITTNGASGLDTPSEAQDTIYYIWIIRKSSDGTVNGLLSASSSAPTMPADYDQKALVGCVGNDNSSNFIPFIQEGDEYWFSEWPTMASGNVGLTWVAIDLTPATLSFFVPSALSTVARGYILSGQNAGITNDSTVGTGEARNKYTPRQNSNIDGMYWELNVITADTLYWIGDSVDSLVRLSGFRINKL